MNRAIIKRKYYAIRLSLESPLSVFSGYDIHTDMEDVYKRQDLCSSGSSFSGNVRLLLVLGINSGVFVKTEYSITPVNGSPLSLIHIFCAWVASTEAR